MSMMLPTNDGDPVPGVVQPPPVGLLRAFGVFDFSQEEWCE